MGEGAGPDKDKQPPESSGGLSRREFLYLNSALLVAAGTASCSRPDMPLDERTELRVFRADDLLSLHFELHNLQIEHRYARTSRLVRKSAGEDAYITVRFSAQGIAEEAFSGSSEATRRAAAAMSQPSRLVFRLPDALQSLDMTMASLLNWQDLEPMLADPASNQLSPSAQQSSVELPAGLSLSPLAGARWRHATEPVTYNNRTELWHTRLDADTVRLYAPGYSDEERYPRSLTAEQRRQLPGREANVQTLMLSSMGGWLDLRGEWQQDAAIQRWEHLATAGQDQRVVVEGPDGFLFPFGHRASRITVTERVVEADENGAPRALLRKNDFIVIKEKTKSYRHGEMAFRSLQAAVEITPALSIPDDEPVYWIETLSGSPFEFPFVAADWGQSELTLAAPALFVTSTATIDEAARIYEAAAESGRKVSVLDAQTANVSRYLPVGDVFRQPEQKSQPRSVGDTQLQLLAIEFGAQFEENDGEKTFHCSTTALQVRLPSLQTFIDETLNQGWFGLMDPDVTANVGEVFLRALPDRGNRIPMHFDKQSGLSGGLAAPSFDVDGVSRLFGPIGDADLIAAGGSIADSDYFAPGAANLLSSFSLQSLLASDGEPEKSPAIPEIYLVHNKLEDDKKDDKKKDDDKEKKDPENDRNDEEESSGDTEKKDKKPTRRELGLGLKWTVPLGAAGEGQLIEFRPVLDDDGESLATLVIDVSAARIIGGAKQEDDKDAEDAATEQQQEASKTRLRAKGKLNNFELQLNLSEETSLGLMFDHIAVSLGPAKKKDENEDEQSADNEEDTKQKSSVETEVEFVLAEINATGALNFLKSLMKFIAYLPPLPDIPEQDATSAYPAKMPQAGEADITVPVGPFDVPTFKWLQFEVSNISVGGSIGLNFTAKPVGDADDTEVPPHVFSFKIASADKPLTLLAAPWGGIAHIGVNFTTKSVTGFQFSLGVVYRAEFDLRVTKAKCEGSLAGMYTWWLQDEAGVFQADLILKLGGQAKLWFMDIRVLLTAVGSYSSRGDLWTFYADLLVRVKIAFFSAQANFVFYYEIAGDNPDRDTMTLGDGQTANAVSNGIAGSDALTEADWLSYRRAFAGVAG